MAKQEKGLKAGFVIKLSDETVQKLSEEEQSITIEDKVEEQNVGEKLPQEIINPTAIKAKKKPEETIVSSSLPNDDDEVDTTEPNSLSDIPIPVKVDENVIDVDAIKEDSKDNSVDSTVADSPVAPVQPVYDYRDYPPIDVELPVGYDPPVVDPAVWGDFAPHISYEGLEAIYTEPTTNHKYIWNEESSSWVGKLEGNEFGRVCGYENDTHVYTEPDGSKFFWDKEKSAWLPKVDENFLALYQMSYGFIDTKTVDNKDEATAGEAKPKETKKEAGVKRKTEPQWFEPAEETNTKVYVSNLPLDMTEEEFVNFMQKCGLVERDPSTQKMKVKMYMDKEHNCFKGDALCTYIKIESVDLALKILDGSDFKGNKIKVEKASFQLKGEYNPALKPKKKKKKELEKLKKMQQKLFDWRPEKFVGERSKHERVVIVKNLFHPTDFDKEVQLILDFQQDLRDESAKCGDVRKVMIYDRHPEGVAQITMKEPEMADAVVQLINGRWFGKRQITAEIWDGRTKYRIAETDADITKRIDKWDKFLEGKDDDAKKSNDGQDPAVSSTEVIETVPNKMECDDTSETSSET